MSGKKVRLIGKVAEFPDGTKASDAYTFMENIKVSKNKIWYIVVKKQDDTLQMVKYNRFQGEDLAKLVEGLKAYYISGNDFDQQEKQLIKNMLVTGENEFSVIKNIPKLITHGEALVSKITKDIISLLS